MYLVCAERSLYWLLWIGTTLWALYQFALVNQTPATLYQLRPLNLQPGTLNRNSYDATDFEWQSLKKLYVNFWYIVLIHFVLSNVFTLANRPALKLVAWIAVTLYATYRVFSVGALTVVLINVLMLLLMSVLGQKLLSYALCFGVVLASQSTQIANRIFNSHDPRQTHEFDFEEKRFLFTYCICFLNARGLSAALDNLETRQKRELQAGRAQFFEKTVTIVAYLLYLPGFFAGPIYLYSDFEQATRIVRRKPERESFIGLNYLNSMKNLLVLIFTVIYYEWLLHWLYSSAISELPALVAAFSNWQWAGFMVASFLLFYLKYTCIFRTFKMLATFDGLASVSPPMPQCVAAMHLSSQLWRKFDVGIYNWLRSYIYDPLVSRAPQSTPRRFLASSVCFLCIALWHLPLTPSLLIWLSLNVISAFTEIWAKTLGQTLFWQRFRAGMSRANYLRLLALAGLPLTVLAVQANLYFLSINERVAYEFTERLLNNSGNYSLYLLLALYCGANVSLDYNRVVKGSASFAECHRLRPSSELGSRVAGQARAAQPAAAVDTRKKAKVN